LNSQLLERLAAETSPLKANQILRTIEDSFTPRQLSEALPFFDRLRGLHRELVAQSDILDVLRRERPQGYERNDLGEDVALYSDPTAETEEKSLVVAFTGRSFRLMTCWTLFLQMLPSSRFDVLILADRSNDHFFNGIQGYADDFLSLIQNIRRDAPFERYRKVYGFGTSTGGLPALRFGLLTGAHRAISIGGQVVWHIHRLKVGGRHALTAFDPLCACDWPRRGQLICVYGELSRTDHLVSLQMQRLVGASRVAITGSRQHNVVYEIFRGGRLRQLYGRLFEFPPADL
jgi:hypothetical protein